MITIPPIYRSRKFWLAVVAVLLVVVQHYLPTIPPEVVDAAVNLIMLLIAMIATEDAAAKIGAGIANRTR